LLLGIAFAVGDSGMRGINRTLSDHRGFTVSVS